MIIIALNLLIGFSQSIYRDPYNHNNNVILNNEMNLLQEKETSMQTTEYQIGNIRNPNIDTESTFGNIFSMGKLIANVFIYGLNPFSINSDMLNNYLEKLALSVLELIRSMMYVLAIVELYMFVKNRKTS